LTELKSIYSTWGW